MFIAYHGTNASNAAKIMKSGFRRDTWYALHLEDALEFGGLHIFGVTFPDNLSVGSRRRRNVEEDDLWQFTADHVPKSRIVSYEVYKKPQIKFENKELREEIFESNQ